MITKQHGIQCVLSTIINGVALARAFALVATRKEEVLLAQRHVDGMGKRPKEEKEELRNVLKSSCFNEAMSYSVFAVTTAFLVSPLYIVERESNVCLILHFLLRLLPIISCVYTGVLPFPCLLHHHQHAA